jgi:alpha-L-fucosidase
VPEFHGIIRSVSAVGFDEKIDFAVTTEGLEFTTKTVKSQFPVAIRIKID